MQQRYPITSFFKLSGKSSPPKTPKQIIKIIYIIAILWIMLMYSSCAHECLFMELQVK